MENRVCKMCEKSNVAEINRRHGVCEDQCFFPEDSERLKGEQFVFEDGAFRVSLVNFESPKKLKDRAFRISRSYRLENRIDLWSCYARDCDEPEAFAFLAYSNENLVGILAGTHRFKIRSWYDWSNKLEEGEFGSFWSMTQLYVERDFRKKGNAKRLIKVVEAYVNSLNQKVAFVGPFTDLGEECFKNIYPAGLFVSDNPKFQIS